MEPMQSTSSFLGGAEYIPADAIFEVTKKYLADPNPNKVNVGAGTYRDENGKPWILPSVRMAKERIAGCDHEYLPIAGLKSFRDAAVNLVFHDTAALKEGRIASCQSLSGTGALHLAGLALRKANPSLKTVYITEPTWSNHELLFESLGFEVQKLPYYKDGEFDFESYVRALECASKAMEATGCSHQTERDFPIFDSAYLGFNSGSVDEDAWAIKYFVENLELEASIALSFAKIMGLYGERTGLITFVTKSAETTRTMNSILENVQRATLSSPPVYGARIASTVLNTPEFEKQWAEDLITMSTRIQYMREKLYKELVRLETPGDWSHIVKQSGMFGYTGLSSAQIKHLQKKYHVYMADTSRISIAGLNESNVGYFAQAINETVKCVK
ncbi:probable aspartate aminotransferase, cytoplasmic [Phialocephala subalpina]|uniref:aspartate transaminase n=1 Tax=Phialocephala subalpina TaxID=576137 RepID=A0A1L7WVP0_9HELO|nr:probable aspartate aminotransferase, cytoplasmic [Phialocephala subalpina]